MRKNPSEKKEKTFHYHISPEQVQHNLPMIHAKKICCFLSLKIGTIIIGVVILLYGIINFGIDAWGFTGDKEKLAALGPFFQDMDRNSFGNPGLNIEVLEHDTDGFEGIYKLKIGVDMESVTSALMISLIFSILLVIAAPILIFGAYKNKHEFVLPILIILPVNVLANCVSNTFFWNNGSAIILEVFLTIICVYMWVCIHDFWKQLREESAAKESLENQDETATVIFR